MKKETYFKSEKDFRIQVKIGDLLISPGNEHRPVTVIAIGDGLFLYKDYEGIERRGLCVSSAWDWRPKL